MGLLFRRLRRARLSEQNGQHKGQSEPCSCLLHLPLPSIEDVFTKGTNGASAPQFKQRMFALSGEVSVTRNSGAKIEPSGLFIFT